MDTIYRPTPAISLPRANAQHKTPIKEKRRTARIGRANALPNPREIYTAKDKLIRLKNLTKESERYILVEGPSQVDAKFCGKWLLAAAKAEALWTSVQDNLSFEEQTVCRGSIPHLGYGAIVMLSRLAENFFSSFAIRLGSDDVGEVVLADEFLLMKEMGFFVPNGECYQMAIPARLTPAVQWAAFRLKMRRRLQARCHARRRRGTRRAWCTTRPACRKLKPKSGKGEFHEV